MSSRKHHYLPRYYLKGFTDAEDGFFVYDKQKNKIFRSGSIATFYENDLNTVTFSDGRTSDFLEEMYTHVENRVWNSLDNIRNSTNKTNIGFLDKMHLYMFLSFLHWRLPSNIDFVEKLAEVAFDKDDDTLSYFHLVDRDGGQIPEEIINAFRSSPPFRKAVKVLLPFAPFLQDKDWDKSLQNWRFLYSGDHKSWYIVGDNPIITEGQNDHDPVKCLQEFVFPVSGRILLVKRPFLGRLDYHREISILTIQSEDDPRKRKVLLGCIVCDDLDDTEQISTIISVACASECSEPLVRVCQQKRGPSTNNLTSFAS